jgi:PleD family two-component response regulator
MLEQPLDLSPKRASVLVAAQAVADGELVQKLLQEEFGNVHLSTKPELAVSDFETHRPSVLVLAFDTLEAAQRYYLGIYRLGTTVHTVPHRTVILCNKNDLWSVYELCRKEHFDDYVLFWPATHDAPRIRMAVHQALRLMSAKALAGAIAPRAVPAGGERVQPAQPAQTPGTTPAAAAAAVPTATHAAASAAEAAAGAPGFAAQRTAASGPERLVLPEKPVVLMVEDDEFQQKLLARLVAGQDIQVVFASTGAEAQQKMWEYKPSLVLMDVGLPDTSGVEATRKIKAIAQFAHVPIVMVTGHSERQVVVESLKAGAIDFLVKPFDKSTLLEKLRLLLQVATAS